MLLCGDGFWFGGFGVHWFCLFVCVAWVWIVGDFCLGQSLALQTKKNTFVLKLTPEFLAMFATQADNNSVMLPT